MKQLIKYPNIPQPMNYHVTKFFFTFTIITFMLIACKDGNVVSVSPVAETTPNANFHVKDGKIYDKNEQEFIMKGINHTCFWGDMPKNIASITDEDGLVKTGANCVRVVFGQETGATTSTERRQIVEAVIAKKMVPVIENHSATCDDNPNDFNTIINNWTLPANVEWLKKYQDKIILNIANEYGWLVKKGNDGGQSVDNDKWGSEYKRAITAIRNAGINSLLMIDANVCGQDIQSIYQYSEQLTNHDPQKNIVFSLHIYKEHWRTRNSPYANEANNAFPFPRGMTVEGKNSPWFIEDALDWVKAKKIPFVIGEFSWNASNGVQEKYDTRTILQLCKDNGIGWIAWSWNQNDDPKLDMLKAGNHLYKNETDLTPFGQLIINDPQLGLKKTAIKPNIW
jgi:mannan endo-1,4-beta-mannosidase